MEPMLKSTVKTVGARCKQLGVMLCDDGATLRADLPRYKVVKGRGVHWMDFEYSTGRHAALALGTRGQALAALLEDLAEGLEDCTDPECEACVTEFQSFEDTVALYRTKRLA